MLFRELAGLATLARRRRYAKRDFLASVNVKMASPLCYDDREETPPTGVVGGAAETHLLFQAPMAERRRCDPYRLVRLLGNGNMGAVYLTERADGEAQQQVAIKFVHSGADSPSFRERFVRERRSLASLNHPGIASSRPRPQRWASCLTRVGIAAHSLVANHERLIVERRFRQVREISQQCLDLDAESADCLDQ